MVFNKAATFSRVSEYIRPSTIKRNIINEKDDVNLYKKHDGSSPTNAGWEETELEDGDALIWNATDGEWQPGEASGSGTSVEMFAHSHSGPGDGGHLPYFMES